MKKLFTVLALWCAFMNPISAQPSVSEADYRIYNAAGEAQTLAGIIEAGSRVSVIFIGENHDDPVAHGLQAEMLRRNFESYGTKRKIALSLEMFERDTQTVLDEYLQSLISENHFLLSSRPWNNYKSDYRPLVEFAKSNKLPVIAANAPRRYVNMVSRGGRDSLNKLSPLAKTWLAPLPFNRASEAYAAKFNKLMGAAPEAIMGLSNILDSQSLWDATMAYSVAEHLKKESGVLVIHLNGGFHTENRLGTPEHLEKYAPGVKFLVVTIKPDENFTRFDKEKYERAGDFVILTNAKLPRSFGQK